MEYNKKTIAASEAIAKVLDDYNIDQYFIYALVPNEIYQPQGICVGGGNASIVARHLGAAISHDEKMYKLIATAIIEAKRRKDNPCQCENCKANRAEVKRKNNEEQMQKDLQEILSDSNMPNNVKEVVRFFAKLAGIEGIEEMQHSSPKQNK